MRPKLQNTLAIVVEQKLAASTVVNNLAREPIKKVKRDVSVTLRAQTVWGKAFSERYQNGGQGGATEENRGYFVFDRSEIAAKNVTLHRGDKVTMIGDQPVAVYLTKCERWGQHKGTNTLEAWDFEDRDLAQG